MFTVFLADDEFTILEGLKRLFDWEKAGFRVIGEASDGDDAYQAIKELKPDLVITDIRMSGLSGLELIRTVKNDGLACKFLIISGYDDFSYCLEALRLGVSDYIQKPIDFSSIGGKLEKIVGELMDNHAVKAASAEVDGNSQVNIFDSRFDNHVKSKINHIVHAVRQVDINKAEAAVDRFIGFIKENKFPKTRVEAMLQELSVLLNNTLYELQQDAVSQEEEHQGEEQGTYQVISINLCELKNPEDCTRILKEAVNRAVAKISRMNDSGMNPFVKVKAYINSHYKEELSLSRLAEEFHMNPSYLSRLFKEKFGINYSDYLTMVRIEKSKKLLLSKNLSINEISELVGFSDYRYFTKVFKRYQGVAPNAYKRNSTKAYTINPTGL